MTQTLLQERDLYGSPPGGRAPFVMTEHPAWWPSPTGAVRVFAGELGHVAVEVGAGGRSLRPLPDSVQADTFCLPAGFGGPAELAAELHRLGPVQRVRNPDLWDALATAVVRQVIRAAQSKRLYRGFAEAFGTRVPLPGGGQLPVFPGPARLLALPDSAFTDTGMAFKRRPLRALADAYLNEGDEWLRLTGADLLPRLQSVPGIGPWTAAAAAADYTNDWSLYPHGDLAVRTWAGRAAPSHSWPDTDTSFAAHWRAAAGGSLSALTVLVLAWGSQHGDIG